MNKPQFTPLEGALLGVLDQRPHSGYDLRRVFATTPLGHYSDSPGALYPALKRLEARGAIEAHGEPSGGRRRRLLRMTPAGRRAFVAWLKTPPTRDDVMYQIDALFLRVAFMSQALPASEPLRFLATMQALLAAHVTELERFLGSAGEAMTPSGRLVFEHGIDRFRHTAAWCARAQRTLRGRSAPHSRRRPS